MEVMSRTEILVFAVTLVIVAYWVGKHFGAEKARRDAAPGILRRED